MLLFLTTNMVTVTSCANVRWFATGWCGGGGGGGVGEVGNLWELDLVK